MDPYSVSRIIDKYMFRSIRYSFTQHIIIDMPCMEAPYMTTIIILLGYPWLFESKNMKKVKGKKKSHGIQEFYEEYPSTGGKPMTYNKESQYHKSLATPMTSKPLNSLALSLCPQTRFALLRGLLENSQ